MLVCYIMRRKIGATPGTCALLCRLRIGCIAVYACTAKGDPHRGIRTRTCPILSRMPLLLGYMGKNGGPPAHGNARGRSSGTLDPKGATRGSKTRAIVLFKKWES